MIWDPEMAAIYLFENGQPIARFDDLAKAEAMRARLMDEIAAMHDSNAERYEREAALL
jgi:thioredoxin-like negative regulator of GroEL